MQCDQYVCAKTVVIDMTISDISGKNSELLGRVAVRKKKDVSFIKFRIYFNYLFIYFRKFHNILQPECLVKQEMPLLNLCRSYSITEPMTMTQIMLSSLKMGKRSKFILLY